MLLDCGGGSCSGGSLTGGYKVIEKEHGVASQSDYPYSAHARCGKLIQMVH